MDSVLERRVINGAFGLGVLLVLAVGVISVLGARRLVDAANGRSRSLDVIEAVQELVAHVERAESQQRGYIITGDQAFDEEQGTVKADIDRSLDKLRRVVANDPRQAARLAELAPVITARLQVLHDVRRTRATEGFEAARALVDAGLGSRLMEDLRDRLDRMELAERRLLTESEERLVARTRSVLWLVSAGSLLSGGILCLAGWRTRREMNSRLATQSRLQAVLDNATAPIAVKDREGRYLLGNAAFAEFVGRSVEQVPGCRDADLFPAGIASMKCARDQVVMETGQALSGEEQLAVRGTARTFLAVCFPLRGADGEVEATCSIATDITERKRVELAMAEATEAAERANVAKDEFIANVSHEIRTPLNGVMGMLDLALATSLTEEQRQHLSVSRAAADGLLAVLNDVLDFSKIGAGRLALDEVPFDARQALADVCSLLRPAAEAKGIALGLAVDDSVPAAVVGDPMRVRQVLLNLVGNALKFTERGRIDVRASALADAAGHATLRVLVADTGIGIAADRLASIFDAFTQADASTTRRYGGTGLGLTISAQLAEAMGGRIEVESAPGVGSTFTFTSRIRLVVKDDSQEASAARGAAHPAATGRSLRILLVEDNPLNQAVATGLLEREGHVVRIAADGAAAVAAQERDDFDIVLMDVQMPVMDGLQATAEIRWRESGGSRRVPIVAMTALATESDRERCLAAGMDAWLTKPIRVAQLRAALAAAVGRPGAPPADPRDIDVDVSEALADIGDDVAFLQQLLGLFDEQARELLAALRTGLAESDARAVSEAAHALKGACANWSCGAAFQLAAQLEQVGATGELNRAPQLLAALELAVAELRAAVQARVAAPATA